MAQKVIWSLRDPEISKLFRLSTEKQLRYTLRKCVISSKPLIMDLAPSTTFSDLIVDKKPKSDFPFKFERLHIVSPKILTKIGSLKNAGGGVIAILPIPEPLNVEAFDAAGMLIVDGVQDSGELGTLLRSAAAFNWRTVWITHTCADPFDPVSLRASQGALFTLPYRIGSLDNAIKHSRKTKALLKLRFVGNLESSGTSLSISEHPLSDSTLPLPSPNGCCLLIQNGLAGSIAPIRDFTRVSIAGVDKLHEMPLSVSASTLMHIIRNRYPTS